MPDGSVRENDREMDSIWLPLRPLRPDSRIDRKNRESPINGSIFDSSSQFLSKNENSSSPPPRNSFESPVSNRIQKTESKRFLIVHAGGKTIALETALVREVTRFPGPAHFDSSPLSTVVHIRGRKIIFSTLDSLLGLPTRHPEINSPMTIVGDEYKEAALMVDQISGISDSSKDETSGREFALPHQKGWLSQKNGMRIAIIDLKEILDRVLFETDRDTR